MVAHVCNSSPQGLRQVDHEFNASLGFIAGGCLKKQKKNLLLKSE
jgi:hypothetical protein